MLIQAVESGFVCGSGGQWLVGVYESAKACQMAAKMPDDAIWQIWRGKAGPDGIVPRGIVITEDDIAKRPPE